MDSTSSKDTLVYDQLNRMLSINAGAKGSYYYDGEGKRLRKDYAGSKTIYLYDQWGNLMTEVDTTGNLMCEYLWANGKLIAKIYQDAFYPEFSGRAGIESGEPGPPPVFQEYIFYYHLDHLGTPLALTNEIRNICWSADYLPFGEIYSELIAPVSNEIRFPGQYHDRESDLYYNWHRYYKPTLGRYYQADPIGQEGGVNLYSYVENNPVSFIDPFGLQQSSANCPKTKTCVGKARVLKGEPKTIGRTGGFGIKVAAGSAAVIPSQWGGKAKLRPYLTQIRGTVGETSFSGITDVIGSSEVPRVRRRLQELNPGLLILELPSSPRDLGVASVELTLPATLPCPAGTVEKK